MVLITSSVLSMAGVLALIVAGFSSVWLFVLFGLACGLCAGPVMSLAGLYIPQSERARGMDACATALRNGIPTSIHSDAPITPMGHLHTMWCAVRLNGEWFMMTGSMTPKS